MNGTLRQYLTERKYSVPSDQTYSHIDEWLDWYEGDVPNFHTYKVYNGMTMTSHKRYRLNMAKTVCEDWANLLLNEKVSIKAGQYEKRLNEILEKNNDKFDYKVSWGCDLQTEHERYLTEQVYKRPVFVTDYPKEIKAFYMKQNEDGKTVAAMDCLVPGIGEIIGGSQREDDYEKLAARMDEMGLNREDYGFYLDLRKYGTVRHSGFGLGFERCIMYLTGMGNIRDVVPFPRTVKNCDL